jgi:hypothetical protein
MTLMRLAALVSIAIIGCWSGAPTTPVAPAAPPAIVTVDAPAGRAGISTSSRAQVRRERFPLHSVWEGTYVCNQGLSSVTLTIDAMRNGTATARYDFGPVPSNPTVPVGAYTLKGEIHATGAGGFSAQFEADEWINKPPTYFMVGLAVESGDGKTMTGTIAHGSCRDFKTTRIR